MRGRAGKEKTGVSPLLRLAIAAWPSLLALLPERGAAFGGALDEGMDRSITGAAPRRVPPVATIHFASFLLLAPCDHASLPSIN